MLALPVPKVPIGILRPGDRCISNGGVNVSQIIDNNNFIGLRSDVWVKGVNTSSLKDDVGVSLDGMIFYCVGNKKYTTALGSSKTVMEVVRVQSDEVLKVLRPIAESRGYRVWGAGTGNLVIAEYVRATRRSVTIRFLNGKRTSIKKRQIAPTDLQWVEEEGRGIACQ